jgi:ketosteroid isomerase-like protein
MTDIHDDRRRLFGALQDPATARGFFERVADDVHWTVQGTHPLAGVYRTKRELLTATFGRLAGVLPDGVKLELEHVFVDGDTTIAELRSISTAADGAPFSNTLCWVCRFDGDTIVEARTYLDSAMVAYAVNRNERWR